ncbi:MAG: ABC transporter substrate-binding protein [Chloroflexi bacterium]|nr:ABC transporter substrate-binding protein [Chloroflexota bacterium]
MEKLIAMASCLVVSGLMTASCAPAAAPPKAAAPSPKSTAVAPASPSASPRAAAARPGGILKHAALQDEGTFDLHTTGRNLPGEQVGLAYSTLLQYDPEDGRRIIPDLAESYQISPDGKRVTFLLRKNIRWHDGRDFTAGDVKFNFDRWMKPPEGVTITRKEIVAPVDRVETPDANTAEVYLKYPSPFFISGIALISAIMLPPQYLKDRKTMEYNILGTGPFKLKRYSRGATIEYVKNESYFIAGRPHLDGVTQYIIPDEAARFAAFRTGQVRTMLFGSTNISPSHAQFLRKEVSDKVNVARVPGLTLGIVHMNVGLPPFNDIRVRQAADMVLDRKKAIDVLEGRGEITGPMVRGTWGLSEDELMKRPGYRGVTADDIERAKALLADAGYPRGFQTEAIVQNANTKEMVYVQDQLKAIGIDMSIKVVDVATLEKRYVARDFSITFYGPGQPLDEPDLHLAYFVTGGGRNYSGFSDKLVDEWYREQSRTMDMAKRKEIVFNIQRRILDQAAIPILLHRLYDVPYWKCVKGYYPEKQVGAFNNVKRQNIWLDEGCR